MLDVVRDAMPAISKALHEPAVEVARFLRECRQAAAEAALNAAVEGKPDAGVPQVGPGT